MGDSLLKKEFKQRDVNRARNLITKDFTAKTTAGIGYQKAFVDYKEGDVWEENGRQWTIKNGIKQNITKLDTAKKALQTPLTCPKCGKSMKYHLHQKMYKIHKMCFDCVVDYEASLRKAGLYEAYEKAMIKGGVKVFIKEIEQYFLESINEVDTFVTENGEVEDWNNNKNKVNSQITADLKQFLNHIRRHLED